MGSAQTLNSRLRVLVAKTYRAERLYGSIRGSQNSAHHTSAAISQTANDIRSREWQRSHHELRIALNGILSQGGNSSAIVKQVQDLREQFRLQAVHSQHAVEAGIKKMKESSRRQEFAAVFKQAADLIRYKARANANRGISDELKGLLETSGCQVKAPSGNTFVLDKFSARTKKAELKQHIAGSKSNVVSLKRRHGS